LELILPSVEYLEAREEYRRSKGEHRKQFQIVGKLKKKHAPMLDLQKYVPVVLSCRNLSF
jgi:hypothetical protein